MDNTHTQCVNYLKSQNFRDCYFFLFLFLSPFVTWSRTLCMTQMQNTIKCKVMDSDVINELKRIESGNCDFVVCCSKSIFYFLQLLFPIRPIQFYCIFTRIVTAIIRCHLNQMKNYMKLPDEHLIKLSFLSSTHLSLFLHKLDNKSVVLFWLTIVDSAKSIPLIYATDVFYYLCLMSFGKTRAVGLLANRALTKGIAKPHWIKRKLEKLQITAHSMQFKCTMQRK